MNVSLFPQELDVLLRRSGVSTLNPELSQGLVQACQALPSEAGQQVAWPVLLDMLDALVVLSADETLLIAALLFDLPMLRPMLPVLPWRSVRISKWSGVCLMARMQRNKCGRCMLDVAAGRNGEGLRRLLLALVHDLRVVPILLARQLAKMRAAGVLLESQRRALAQLTRDIHAPLANRLGIWQLKWELEDLAFCYLESEIYRSIASALDESRVARERYISVIAMELSRCLLSMVCVLRSVGVRNTFTVFGERCRRSGCISNRCTTCRRFV